jgi:predicted transport protein
VNEYTLEHIMPQNKKISMAWKEALGHEWGRIHETWLHTLGNLTLTGYNSEYSDRPFNEKRDMKGGFKVSPLNLNQELGRLEHWNEDAIKLRADQLSTIAIDVWSYPPLYAVISLPFPPRNESKTGYTIEDHPYLLDGISQELFKALQKEVLDINPIVTEDFLKRYVAYKAETNFIDVEPQKKGLRLSINMPFPEIIDPRGLCRDISGVGRWGNGDVEVRLSSLDELPYIMGLIRQSYERQIESIYES